MAPKSDRTMEKFNQNPTKFNKISFKSDSEGPIHVQKP